MSWFAFCCQKEKLVLFTVSPMKCYHPNKIITATSGFDATAGKMMSDVAFRTISLYSDLVCSYVVPRWTASLVVASSKWP